MNEIIYTSYSQLGSPRIFWQELKNDLKTTKELGWRLFITNLHSQYRQSWLGYIWLIIPPFFTMQIWLYLTRVNILKSNIGAEIYPSYILSGIFIWQIFVECLNCPLQQLNAQKRILVKIKAPSEAFILAGIGAICFNTVIRIAVLLFILLFFGLPLKITLVFVPFGILAIALLGLAIGLFVTPLGLLYSDVLSGMNLVVSLWFFVTPIVYSSAITSNIIKYNPVTPLLVTTRNWILIDQNTPEKGFFLIAFCSLLLFITSWGFYRLARPHVIARLSG